MECEPDPPHGQVVVGVRVVRELVRFGDRVAHTCWHRQRIEDDSALVAAAVASVTSANVPNTQPILRSRAFAALWQDTQTIGVVESGDGRIVVVVEDVAFAFAVAVVVVAAAWNGVRITLAVAAYYCFVPELRMVPTMWIPHLHLHFDLHRALLRTPWKLHQ